MDFCFDTKSQIKPMGYPCLTTDKVKQIVKKLKPKKAAGPDKMKTELYKVLVENDACMEAIRTCFQQIIDE